MSSLFPSLVLQFLRFPVRIVLVPMRSTPKLVSLRYLVSSDCV